MKSTVEDYDRDDPIKRIEAEQVGNLPLNKIDPPLNIEKLFVGAVDEFWKAPMRQKVIWLKERGNYPVNEIAERLGINVRTVRRLLHN